MASLVLMALALWLAEPPVVGDATGGSAPVVDRRVQVPAGCFEAGCHQADRACEASEKPRHRVCLEAFFIDRTEVTVAAYERCARARACPRRGRGALCNAPGAEKARHPANCVSWEAARAYCAWDGGRLPTEAEWERAAAGPKGALYPWGDAVPVGRLAALHEHDRAPGTSEVCGHPEGSSPDGLCDLAGNVFEWVSDAFDARAYEALAPDVRSPRGPCDGAPDCPGFPRRVIRGGGFALSAHLLRTSARSSAEGERSDLAWVGFRCVSASFP